MRYQHIPKPVSEIERHLKEYILHSKWSKRDTEKVEEQSTGMKTILPESSCPIHYHFVSELQSTNINPKVPTRSLPVLRELQNTFTHIRTRKNTYLLKKGSLRVTVDTEG